MGSFDFFVHGFRGGDAGAADALMEHFGLDRALAEVFELSVPAVLVSAVPERLLPVYREALERCGAAIQITESDRPVREPSAEPPRLDAGVELELPLPVAARPAQDASSGAAGRAARVMRPHTPALVPQPVPDLAATPPPESAPPRPPRPTRPKRRK